MDPDHEQITVLELQDSKYVPHGIFQKASTATSKLLKGFSVNVADVFAAP